MTIQPPEAGEGAKKCWHVGANCPQCDLPSGMPKEAWEGDKVGRGETDPDELVCPACGGHWTTDDPDQIARAWFGWGAYRAMRRNGHI